ncbi:MAG: flagellar hook assembly protein FlgD [Desulfovibrionaceae bacterium]|nr:flagellar hook assembly protein FlgD [Desulfovibrionaceae bacterium]
MSTVSGVNSTIIGAAEREFAAQTTSGSSDLDKMAFLQLLVAQLQHQDPLNPMDDTTFVTQLAQFSELETLQNISTNMDSVIDGMARQESLNASNYLGKYVESYGDQISVDSSGNRTAFYYYLEENVVGGSVNIMDTNGNIIRSYNLGAKSAGGPYELNWDGYDYSGQKAPEGVYLVGMSCLGSNGNPVTVASQVTGKVSSVYYEDGTQYLGLEDGRVINMNYVIAVRNPLESDYAETATEAVQRVRGEIDTLKLEIYELDEQIERLQAIISDANISEEERLAAQENLKLAEAARLVAKTEKELLEEELEELEDKLAA